MVLNLTLLLQVMIFTIVFFVFAVVLYGGTCKSGSRCFNVPSMLCKPSKVCPRKHVLVYFY